MFHTLKRKAAALLCACFVAALPISALAAGETAKADASPLAAGYLHSAIVKEDSTLWMAGSNSHGQLGNGTAGPQDETDEVPEGEDNNSDVFIQIMENIQAVYAGYLNTFAIDQDGTLYGWGCNENSLLGLGDTENRVVPTQVLTDVISVAPGRFHTAAVGKDGTLWTWGWNDSGQLGNGSTLDITAPKEVLSDVRSVATGMKHTMAVKTDDTLWAAGDNTYGQLADGGTEGAETFRQVMDHVQSVACSPFGTLIVKTDGTLWACGYNDNGDLGNGTEENIPEPVKILDNVASVVCSKDFGSGEGFSAAIDREGTLYAWGSDSYAQYGPEPSTSPIQVAKGVTDVSLGGGHMLYLLEDGSVQAIGNNEKGQLGNESTRSTSKVETVTEGVAPSPRPKSPWPVIGLIIGIVTAVVLVFVLLIVRTLRGKKPKKAKSVKPEKPKRKEKPRISDRDLIRLTGEMEQSQKEAEKAEKSEE